MSPNRLARPLTSLFRLLAVLLAVAALGGQLATASLAADRVASGLAVQAAAAPVLCGAAHRIAIIRQAPPVRPAPPPLLWVLSSGPEAADLLPPEHAASPSPARRAESRAGTIHPSQGPPGASRTRPYPRGPPTAA